MLDAAYIDALPTQRRVLVSDFDGTLAHPDFYRLVRDRLVPADTPDYWQSYRGGAITHFDALKAYFAAAEGGESAFLQVLESMELPPNLPAQIQRLENAGWSVLVVSAGCQWYIDRLLARAGVELPVLTNPGQIEGGRLVMRRPGQSAFFSHENGVDKLAVVQRAMQGGRTVAYCGDGYTDLPAAKAVAEPRRFARADLAAACHAEGLGFQPFENWVDVIDQLVVSH